MGDLYVELDDVELAKLDTRVGALHTQNIQNIQRAAQMGANIDIHGPRIEHFAKFLVEVGLLTRTQQLREQEKWELDLRTQLQPVMDQIQARAEQMRKAAMEQARAAGQDVKTEGGIVLPGNGRFKK